VPHWIYYLLLLILLVLGWLMTVATLPGLWVMVVATIAYGALTGWIYFGVKTVLVLTAIGVVAELVEMLAGGAGAKRAGASKRGMLGAVVGGLLGAVFLSILIPIFPIGTIIGACAGSMLGASLVEIALGQELSRSMRIGIGAAKGRLIGIMSKLVFGLIIFVIAAWEAFPLAPPPAAIPSTAPATMAV
jgi:uncharacterized protein